MIWAVMMPMMLGVSATISFAQERPDKSKEYKKWLSVGPKESAIVLIIETDVKLMIVRNKSGKVIDKAKWSTGFPFFRQFRVAPGTYQIGLKGPIEALTVSVDAGSITNVRIAPYNPKNGMTGARATVWKGNPPSKVEHIFQLLVVKGTAYLAAPRSVNRSERILYVNTEPPWPIPPPPKKK